MISYAEYEARRKQKKYCKDCKFKSLLFPFNYCEPYIPVGIRFDDYDGPEHLVRRKTIGSFQRSKQNENNDCKHYRRRWWKFRRPK